MTEHKFSYEQNFNCPFEHTSLTSVCTRRKCNELAHSLMFKLLHVFLYLDICSGMDLLFT